MVIVFLQTSCIAFIIIVIRIPLCLVFAHLRAIFAGVLQTF